MAHSGFARCLRLISRSMASRIISSLGSASDRTASTRASTPSANGSVILSGYSFLRPTRGVEAYV